jgi:hypothetical protein
MLSHSGTERTRRTRCRVGWLAGDGAGDRSRSSALAPCRGVRTRSAYPNSPARTRSRSRTRCCRNAHKPQALECSQATSAPPPRGNTRPTQVRKQVRLGQKVGRTPASASPQTIHEVKQIVRCEPLVLISGRAASLDRGARADARRVRTPVPWRGASPRARGRDRSSRQSLRVRRWRRRGRGRRPTGSAPRGRRLRPRPRAAPEHR